MKVKDLSIGKLYKNEIGERVIYMGVIVEGMFIHQHDFDSMDSNGIGGIYFKEEIEKCINDC